MGIQDILTWRVRLNYLWDLGCPLITHWTWLKLCKLAVGLLYWWTIRGSSRVIQHTQRSRIPYSTFAWDIAFVFMHLLYKIHPKKVLFAATYSNQRLPGVSTMPLHTEFLWDLTLLYRNTRTNTPSQIPQLRQSSVLHHSLSRIPVPFPNTKCSYRK